MSDIEVVLGAKNEASAVLKAFQDEVAATSKSVSLSLTGMLQVGGIQAAVDTALASVRSLVGFVNESAAAFDAANKSATQLRETLALTGQGQAAEGLESVAAGLERLTNVDEKKILAVMAAAARNGTGADELDDMAKAAIGLGRVFGRDIAGGAELAKSAVAGNFEAFKGLIPNIDALGSNQERLNAVMALAAEGLRNQAEAAGKAGEQALRVDVQFRNLQESVGKLITPVRELAAQALGGMSLAIDAMIPKGEKLNETVKGLTDSVAKFSGSTLETFVKSITSVEVAISRWNDSLVVVDASLLLFSERAKSVAEFAFTTLMDYATWFHDNFLNLLRDTAVGASFIVENMGNNLAIAIKRGFGGDEPYKPLLDGFESATAKLPAIGSRAISEVEKALKGILDETLQSMAVDVDSMTRARMEAIAEKMKEQADAGKPKLTAKDDPIVAAMSMASNQLSAFESRVLTRGQSDTPLDRLIEIQQKALREQQELRRAVIEGRVSRDEVRLVKVGGAF